MTGWGGRRAHSAHMWRTGRAVLSRKWPESLEFSARHARLGIMASVVLLVAACGSIPGADYFSFGSAPPPPPPAQPSQVGAGQVKVALVLPMSAPGNAGA